MTNTPYLPQFIDTCLFMDIWVVYAFVLLWKMVQTFDYKYLNRHISFLLAVYLAVELLSLVAPV